ncbi:hypothetical protein MNEG_8961 [Monoraphidium neglectum]|uniref:Uncharacterized protein n=1 Tax=Monoraphidium neglectum TaxID=145388 RepID=A0A0D2KU90_9CHLO|nr:hypothetical protein MNEG_8961 [Monoraphidium neglectum]KIY99003.1 hypothetical protein MNEG_8961 [Monoraphidium neglectum]|eukprot:XP_013898023.1 hypothetical protein MNEG_8961 [Monoraphidium neglectum]
MDAAARAAVEAEAIQSGRLPSVEDAFDVATLLVCALTAPEATAAAAEVASAAYYRLYQSDAHVAAAVAALLAPASRSALVAALEGGGHAALEAGEILFDVVCGGARGGAVTSETNDRIAGTDGMIESLVHALQRATGEVLQVPEAPLRHIRWRAFRNLCFVLETLMWCEGCAARILAAPGAVGGLAAAGRVGWRPSDARFLIVLTMFDSMIEALGADAARALMAEEGVFDTVVAAAGKGDGSIVLSALKTLRLLARADAETAGRIIADANARAALTGVAITGPQSEAARAAGRCTLRAIARAGHAAAVAVAVKPCLAAPADGAERGRARAVLMEFLPTVAVDALEAVARDAEVEAAALRAEVAEQRAIPVNTRAAIVELAATAART